MKKVAIVQSNYIPWKGYFDLINSVDEFILYDDVQYTKRDWRNRNIVKTKEGLKWLSIPVETKGKFYQKINETKISNHTWAEQHWKTLCHAYSKAEFFKEYKDIVEETYRICSQEQYLSKVNYEFLTLICRILNIKTKISWSTDYFVSTNEKNERLIMLCKAVGAEEYISGPAAQSYIKPELFESENIKLSYIDYSSYSVYRQMYGEFVHGVTILDLIFNEGPNASRFMKSF